MTLSISTLKEKWQHAGFQKYLQNTGWLFLGRIFSLIVSFFIGTYIARYLGPDNYGLMNYVFSFVGIFGFLTSLGIDNIVSREIIIHPHKKDDLIGTGFGLKLIGTTCTILLIWLVTLYAHENSFTQLLIIIFSLSYLPQAFNIIEIFFQSQVLSKKVVYAQISATAISTLLKIIVIYTNKGIFWLTCIYVVEAFLLSIFLIHTFIRSSHKLSSLRFDRILALQLLKDSWPLILSSMAIGIYMKLDQVMIKHLLGNEQVGLYTAAVKLSEMWYFIPMLICTSVFPSIINAWNTNKTLFLNRLQKLYFFIFYFSCGTAILIFICAPLIINVLFGEAYLQSIQVLRIYVWSGIGVSLGIVVSQYLISQNFTRVALYNTIIGAICNVTLNIILIPKFGIIGAAYATIAAYFIVPFAIFFHKNTRSHGYFMLKSILYNKSK